VTSIEPVGLEVIVGVGEALGGTTGDASDAVALGVGLGDPTAGLAELDADGVGVGLGDGAAVGSRVTTATVPGSSVDGELTTINRSR
jgi:hypothetical protein